MAKTILYVDVPGFKPLPASPVLHTLAFGYDVIGVTSIAAAMKAIDTGKNLAILVCNAPHGKLLEHFRGKLPASATVLVTDQPMDHYARELALEEDKLLDHVIASLDDHEWVINELRATLQKIIRADIFGIDKYLLPQTPIYTHTVTDSPSRDILNAAVMKLADSCKLGAPVAKQAYAICEELLMNAIYDAPQASGRNVYSELPRSTAVHLAAHEYSTLNFACDGKIFAIAVRDPFGALTKEKYFEYLKKVLRRNEGDGIIDKKKGGAGLGLYKILYSSHALICNSQPGTQTEVISLINAASPCRDFGKMPRSVHFFRNA